MLLHRERYSLRILEGPVGWGDLLTYENYPVISNWTWTFKDISQVNGLDQSIDIEAAFCCNQHGCTWGEYIQLHRDTTVGSLTLVPNLRNGVVSFDDSPLVSWWKVLGVCLAEGWGRPTSISPEFVFAQFCMQECSKYVKSSFWNGRVAKQINHYPLLQWIEHGSHMNFP